MTERQKDKEWERGRQNTYYPVCEHKCVRTFIHAHIYIYTCVCVCVCVCVCQIM